MTSRVMILALCGMATVAHAEEPCASLSTMQCMKVTSRCTIDTETYKCKDSDICGAGCAAFTAAQCSGSMGRGCGCALHHTGACLKVGGTSPVSPPASLATSSGAECPNLSRAECVKDGKAKGCYVGSDMMSCSACPSKSCAGMSFMECGLAASCGCGVTAAQTCAKRTHRRAAVHSPPR